MNNHSIVMWHPRSTLGLPSTSRGRGAAPLESKTHGNPLPPTSII